MQLRGQSETPAQSTLPIWITPEFSHLNMMLFLGHNTLYSLHNMFFYSAVISIMVGYSLFSLETNKLTFLSSFLNVNPHLTITGRHVIKEHRAHNTNRCRHFIFLFSCAYSVMYSVDYIKMPLMKDTEVSFWATDCTVIFQRLDLWKN